MLDSPKSFETQRLRLRHPTIADANAIFEFASDPKVARYMEWAIHTRVETVVDYLRGCLDRLAIGSEASWAITVPPADRAIGMISCRFKGHAIDFGYALARKYWRRGF